MKTQKTLTKRVLSLVTALFFLGSTMGVYAQNLPSLPPPPSSTYTGNVSGIAAGVDLNTLLGANPELLALQANARSIESALRTIDTTAAPLYSKVVPANMDTMSIAERVKAIVGNTKNVLSQGMSSYKSQVADWNQAHGVGPNPNFEQELSLGMNQLGLQAGEMPLGGKGNIAVDKLKSIINAIKERLQSLITLIRAKIAAVAQRVGLMKKKDPATEEKKSAFREDEGYVQASQDVQYADTFSGKLSKGVTEGTQAAKTSLKNSFSFTNLAVTTAVAVGTNLAIDMVNGEKPSLKKAAKAVASVEFAGSVVGAALGAAGGQFTSTLVRTFIPGPIGAMVGAVIPVMFGSAAGQMGGSLARDIKSGQFNLRQAWQRIDKVDLIGSSIGSTIGMALGAPIPIIGPIIGGIVGGFLGSRVAKWITGMSRGGKVTWFPRGNNLPGGSNTGSGYGISIGQVGESGGQGLGIFTGGQVGGGLTPVGDVSAAPVAVSGNLKQVEEKYYQTYMEYNRLLQAGDQTKAQQVYGELKTYHDQYNSLKKGQ
jgi:hypothetical protein